MSQFLTETVLRYNLYVLQTLLATPTILGTTWHDVSAVSKDWRQFLHYHESTFSVWGPCWVMTISLSLYRTDIIIAPARCAGSPSGTSLTLILMISTSDVKASLMLQHGSISLPATMKNRICAEEQQHGDWYTFPRNKSGVVRTWEIVFDSPTQVDEPIGRYWLFASDPGITSVIKVKEPVGRNKLRWPYLSLSGALLWSLSDDELTEVRYRFFGNHQYKRKKKNEGVCCYV